MKKLLFVSILLTNFLYAQQKEVVSSEFVRCYSGQGQILVKVLRLGSLESTDYLIQVVGADDEWGNRFFECTEKTIYRTYKKYIYTDEGKEHVLFVDDGGKYSLKLKKEDKYYWLWYIGDNCENRPADWMLAEYKSKLNTGKGTVKNLVEKIKKEQVPVFAQSIADVTGVKKTIAINWDSFSAYDEYPLNRMKDDLFESVVNAFKELCENAEYKKSINTKITNLELICTDDLQKQKIAFSKNTLTLTVQLADNKAGVYSTIGKDQLSEYIYQLIK